YSAASVWTGRQLFVWGGTGAGSQPLADGALYDPATGTWRPLPAAPFRSRGDATAVWTGRQVIVLGGRGGEGRTALDAAAYDAAADRWSPLPAVPVGRGAIAGELTAVAAGEQVYLWVGWNRFAGTAVSSGVDLQRYDAATGTWSAVDIRGEP